jgi:hypothetical protein
LCGLQPGQVVGGVVSLKAAGGEEIVRSIVLHPQPPREEAATLTKEARGGQEPGRHEPQGCRVLQEVTPERVGHVVPEPPCC